MTTIQHWIGGSSTAGVSTRTASVFDPATGQQHAEVLLAEPGDVATAVDAARKGFEKWRQESLTRRARVMFNFRNLVMEHADELARVIAAEHGKVFGDAKGEIIRGMEISEFVCGLPQLLKGEYSDQVSTEVDSYSFRQPLGVCAGITPFNFPVMVPMWMHPIAIACGNAFILKPSERVPSASNFFAQLYADAGLPDGVFNVVHGDKIAVDAILDHPDIAAVSFVGSTPIARYVYERGTSKGKRVQALGGAKNHCLVLPDADLEFAAKHITAAAYGSAGQRCMAISVAVAVGSIGDDLVDRLKRKALEVKVGPASDHESEMGPVITAQSRDRIVDYIDRGAAAGATLVVDGRTRTGTDPSDGFFVGPTLFDHVMPDMDIYRDEIFGPVLVVVRVATTQEGIDLINRNPYGNGTCVFTNSGSAARKFQRDVAAGMVGINVPVPVPMAFYSFGGWKASLFGDKHIHGPEGIKFYTRGKVVTARWPELDVPEEHTGHMHFPVAV
jgi:malonate-semialdehyde dehydrogenase (acetylating) / methylmalonate-semialdehyde dehydrogenase